MKGKSRGCQQRPSIRTRDSPRSRGAARGNGPAVPRHLAERLGLLVHVRGAVDQLCFMARRRCAAVRGLRSAMGRDRLLPGGDCEAPPAPALHYRAADHVCTRLHQRACPRSEEHTSELQSLMRISYAVFCLKKKTTHKIILKNTHYINN